MFIISNSIRYLLKTLFFVKNLNKSRSNKKKAYFVMSIALLIYSFIFIAFVVLKINGIDASNNKEYSGTIGYVIIGVMILMFFLSLLTLKKAYEKTDLMVIGLKEMTFASALSDLVIIEEFVYRLDFMVKDFLLLNSIHSYFPLAVGVAMACVSISMIFRFIKYRT